jgi:hypothetical protein
MKDVMSAKAFHIMAVLPDWGKTGQASAEELQTQEEFVNTI